MRSFGAVPFLVCVMVLLSCTYSATSLANPVEPSALVHHVPSDSSSAPIIDWFGPPENSTEGMTICWDGLYNGQTEEVWDFEVWVNDTDGVDSVIFRFLCGSSSEWENKTTTLIEGNSTSGLYAGNLTYPVEWNWEKEYPVVPYSVFSFKVFANDSLGNWAETTTRTYMGGYVVVYPPSTSTTLGIPYGWLFLGAIGGAFGIVAVIFVLYSIRIRRSLRASHEEV